MFLSKLNSQLIKFRKFSKVVKPQCKPNVSKTQVPTTMDALVLNLEEKEVNLEKVPIPKCVKSDEVMVQVAYAEANLTDLEVLEGQLKSSQQKVIPGRIMSGIASKIGDKVQHIKVGDHVVVSPCVPHSLCSFCVKQNSGCCVKEPTGKLLGVDRNGGWAEFCVAPMNTVYKTPPATFQQAALLPAVAQTMCSLMSMQIQPEQSVVILGAGLEGLLFAIMLRHNNHEKVTICEDNSERVNILEGLDLCYTVISPDQLPEARPDVVISSGAGTNVMQQALDGINHHGLFVINGTTGGNGKTPELQLLPREISRKQIIVQGLQGTPANASNVPETVITHLLDVEKLGIETIPFQCFKEGLTKISTRDANSVLFEIKKDL